MNGMNGTKNLVLTVAGGEYSYNLPDGVRTFTVQCRTSNDVRMSYDAGGTGTEYITIKAGAAYSPACELYTNGMKLYFQCAVAGLVVEIEWWK